MGKMEGKVNADEYTKTVSSALVDHLDRKSSTGNYHFQQENAAIHTAEILSLFSRKGKSRF